MIFPQCDLNTFITIIIIIIIIIIVIIIIIIITMKLFLRTFFLKK